MNAVEVHNLRKEFVRKDGRKRTRVAALRGVTFEVARGECIAILGQNGSGKSTLVRLLSTLLLPDGGSARIFGHDVSEETRAVRTLVNRVSVEASFFKKMSATENLAYAARFYGLTPKETKRADPGDPRRGSASRPRGGRIRWRTCRAGRSRRSRSRGRCSPRRCCSCSTSRPRASTRARSSRCRTSSARCGRPTTRRSCSAPTTSPRPRSSPSGSGSSTTASCSAWSRPTRSRSATASRRSRRRSSPRPARRSRTSGRNEEEEVKVMTAVAARARHELIGLLRRRRAELVPGQALRDVGGRVLRLDDREHALDRLHLEGRRASRRAGERPDHRAC